MKKFMLLFIISILVFTGCSQEVEKEQEEILTSVEVTEVKLDSINLVTTFTGRVQSVSTIPVMVQTPGEVEEVFVTNNQYVSKGDKLFSLVDTNNARQLQQAQASYDSANANYMQVKEQIELAKDNLERTQKLFEAGAVSESQLEQAKLQASEQPLKAAKAGLDQAKVSYDSAKDAYEDTVVKANVSGYISNINIEEGSFATSSQPTMMINDNSELSIMLNVSEKYVNKIQQGDQVGINIVANDLNYDGKVKEVSSTMDANSLLYPVEISFEAKDESINNGMIAQVEIITESRNEVLIVPSEAVLLRGNIEIVFVNEDNIAIQKEVTTGIDNGEITEIIDGLEENQQIIVLGQNFLSNGDKINVVRGE